MILKTTIILIALIWCVRSEQEDSKKTPVPIFDLRHILIQDYSGPLDANTMELLKHAQSLTFKDCNFTLFNENCLNPVKNLEKLQFTNCQFAAAQNDPSICCEKLLEVAMTDINAYPIPEDDFKQTAAIKSLQRLYFFKMDVPLLSANALNGSNLINMTIVDSNLKTIEDGAFNGMDKLEVLNLQHNKLKTIPTATLEVLKTLKELNLSNNLLEKITTADIPALPNVVKLNFGHNPIKEINLNGLRKKLPNMREIDISGIEMDQLTALNDPNLGTSKYFKFLELTHI